jgi:hypothetical protein
MDGECTLCAGAARIVAMPDKRGEFPLGDCAVLPRARRSARELAAAPRRGRDGTLHEMMKAITGHQYVKRRRGRAAG